MFTKMCTRWWCMCSCWHLLLFTSHPDHKRTNGDDDRNTANMQHALADKWTQNKTKSLQAKPTCKCVCAPCTCVSVYAAQRVCWKVQQRELCQSQLHRTVDVDNCCCCYCRRWLAAACGYVADMKSINEIEKFQQRIEAEIR